MTSTSVRPVLLVVGVGPGLGMSVAHRFGSQGYSVALVSRSSTRHAD
jgi:NAD(P)-dependent dehydrogenase (short-subunit alcohol dehydrogenase family)